MGGRSPWEAADVDLSRFQTWRQQRVPMPVFPGRQINLKLLRENPPGKWFWLFHGLAEPEEPGLDPEQQDSIPDLVPDLTPQDTEQQDTDQAPEQQAPDRPEHGPERPGHPGPNGAATQDHPSRLVEYADFRRRLAEYRAECDVTRCQRRAEKHATRKEKRRRRNALRGGQPSDMDTDDESDYSSDDADAVGGRWSDQALRLIPVAQGDFPMITRARISSHLVVDPV